ncbi:MAG TPA: PDZ domain-containing protein [Anaeromyxobacter sp.]|nr:PDZ domain-containing protein [Anaeromyxobacter sp.]
MRYHLTLPEPDSHLFHVEATLARPGRTAELCFPIWTPGSYLVREFARHVEGLKAEDEAGRPLPLTRLDKHRVSIASDDALSLVLRYRVYANELSVRTCHLDGSHGYLNGAAVFPYAVGRLGEPCELEVIPPEGWAVSTALQGGPTEFTARDYDELVDSPLEIGRHPLLRFEAGGKPHEIAIWGRGRIDEAALIEDVRRVVEVFARLFGGLPYPRYLFILHLTEKRRGGLEHARSTTLNVVRTGFYPREAYEETLSLVAHEFFHLWNVKRLRPAAFLPYDYGREQYTRLLWWFEGVTSYYDGLALVRAGITEPRRYLRRLGEALTKLSRTPGAAKTSAEEASFLAWVKLYRPDENSGNSAVSYYLKGELLALALDLALRRAGSSLDILLRRLYARYSDGGLPEDGIERAAAGLLGEEGARAFFDRYVRGVEPLELGLERVGVRVQRRPAAGFEDKGGTPPPAEGKGEAGWLGIELAAPGPKLIVQSVREGSPAWRAGLYAEDEIVAEDGFRVDRGALWDRLCQEGPSGRLRLTVFRRDELRQVEVPLAPAPKDTVFLEPVPEATADVRAAFEVWCGGRWPLTTA